MAQSLTFLCVTSYFKGNDFLRACKEAGNTVLLLTAKKLEHKPWAGDCIDDFFFVEEKGENGIDLQELVEGLALMMRTRKIDRVVALDDFDVEKVALLREQFRLPGMGQSTARYFRDKLAMRIKAAEAGIRVPGFSALFNDGEINEFIEACPPPWMIKPRSEVSAAGIVKLHTPEELWKVIRSLGDRRHEYLVEQYKPGEVYHVDALSVNGQVVFSWVSQYLSPPFDIIREKGIFRSATVAFESTEAHALETLAVDVLKAFGMQNSASHTEAIRCHEDGHFYFLETSSRVAGAHLVEMVEASSGVNLWREWAKLETAVASGEVYRIPRTKREFSGIVLSLSRNENVDMTPFDAPEVVWQLDDPHQVGVIVASNSREPRSS